MGVAGPFLVMLDTTLLIDLKAKVLGTDHLFHDMYEKVPGLPNIGAVGTLNYLAEWEARHAVTRPKGFPETDPAHIKLHRGGRQEHLGKSAVQASSGADRTQIKKNQEQGLKTLTGDDHKLLRSRKKMRENSYRVSVRGTLPETLEKLDPELRTKLLRFRTPMDQEIYEKVRDITRETHDYDEIKEHLRQEGYWGGDVETRKRLAAEGQLGGSKGDHALIDFIRTTRTGMDVVLFTDNLSDFPDNMKTMDGHRVMIGNSRAFYEGIVAQQAWREELGFEKDQFIYPDQDQRPNTHFNKPIVWKCKGEPRIRSFGSILKAGRQMQGKAVEEEFGDSWQEMLRAEEERDKEFGYDNF